MRVDAHVADNGGCGWYRLIQPIKAIKDAAPPDLDIRMIESDSPEASLKCVMRDRPDGTAECLDVLGLDCDVLVVQRPMQADLCAAIPAVQAKGIAVVVEIDDDFTSLSSRNTAWAALQQDPARHERWLRRICDMADMVTVTTPRLAKVYGRHGRVRIIPNQLPADLWDAAEPRYRPQTPRPLLGWSGSVATHPDDLQQTRGAVAVALVATDAAMFVVGTGQGVRERLALHDDTPLRTTGWLSLTDYPHGMASCDVGIVPLDLTPFNEAKSDLKGLEFAAVGVPFVASPTGPYVALAAAGAGVIAAKPKEWRSTVRSLLADRTLREEVAGRGREATAGRRYHLTWHLWAEAWEQALRNRRGQR